LTKLKIFLILLLGSLTALNSQNATLYSKAYGKNTDPAVVFFHGGPGFNCANFEFSTAEELASKGFYVVVFDQRGCGRSKNYKSEGPYSFAAQIQDVLDVLLKYNIKKATLVGHSWGGTLSTKFAEKHPEMVERMIFIGAPLSYQMTFKGILKRCNEKFSKAKDSVNLKRVAYVQKFDTSSINYSGSCFMFAVANGFYSPASSTEFSQNFKKKMAGTEQEKLFSQMETAPVQGVYAEEKYITIHMYQSWLNLRKTIPLYAIYGSEDGLFDQKQLDLIADAVTKDRFYLVKDASHNVFIDRHPEFMELISNILNKSTK
jgi:proline iminopeptidase